MYKRLKDALIGGVRRIRENPQLIFTLFIALVISVAFIFITNRFATVAYDAQDRLVNVRVGSIQDAFSVLAEEQLHDTAFLQDKINRIASINETIEEFSIIKIEDAGTYTTIASLNIEDVGQVSTGNDLLFSLARTDPNRSFTVEDVIEGRRAYKTARFVSSPDDSLHAIIVTKQNLSIADKKVDDTIRTSIFLFFGIMLLILFLFFRHSKIIDYTVLYRRLKEVDQLKDDFISMASHELRTPLTLIRGYAESIKETGNDDQKKNADIIDGAAKQLDSLVADMLDVSKIEQGRMSFSMKLVNLSEFAPHVIDRFKITAEAKGLTYETAIEQGLTINADEDRLAQVLVNLIGNAIKYTPHGEVRVSMKRQDTKVVVRVSDTGMGISAEEQKKLFQKFYRIRSKETEGISGTGLGLWITAQIVEKLNGTISVESIQGKGTDFIVVFPAAKTGL